MIKFSIITPTIQRLSLLFCCESVNAQTYTNWEHVIQIDRQANAQELLDACIYPQRTFYLCIPEHHNSGNTCRHLAWERATGEYLIHLDDDNYLADPQILESIAISLEKTGKPDWACFPISRFGWTFFTTEPRSCHADTANIVVKRHCGRWPDRPEYTADGFWIDDLRARADLSFAAFPEHRPIVVMEKQGKGEL